MNSPVAYSIAFRWGFGKWGWMASFPMSGSVYHAIRYTNMANRVEDLAQREYIHAKDLIGSIKADMTRIFRNYQDEAQYVNRETDGKFASKILKICNFYGFDHPLNDLFQDQLKAA